MPSLLDSGDPILSLLSNFVSAGGVGQDDTAAPGQDGGDPSTSMSVPQQRSAIDSLLAAAGSLAGSSGARYGPPVTPTQAVLGSMIAARNAATADQAQQVNNVGLLGQLQTQALNRQLLQRKIEQQAWSNQFLQRITPMLLGEQPGAAAPAAAPATTAPGYTPGASVKEALANVESGQRGYQATNAGGYSGRYQLGSELAARSGFSTPANAENLSANEWSGQFNIPGFPGVKTRDDFLANPAAQDQAYSIAMGKNNQALSDAGLDQYIGQTINGVPVTREGLLAGAWLGGVNRRQAVGRERRQERRARFKPNADLALRGTRCPSTGRPGRPGRPAGRIGADDCCGVAAGCRGAGTGAGAGGRPWRADRFQHDDGCHARRADSFRHPDDGRAAGDRWHHARHGGGEDPGRHAQLPRQSAAARPCTRRRVGHDAAAGAAG